MPSIKMRQQKQGQHIAFAQSDTLPIAAQVDKLSELKGGPDFKYRPNANRSN